MSDVIIIECSDYAEAVREAFRKVNGAAALAGFDHILLKPNLVNASPFPVTTPPDFTAAVIDAVREVTDAPITVAEGSGDINRETDQVFEVLGYTEMAREKSVDLLDLNHAPLRHETRPGCPVFPEMWLPEAGFTHAIVSLPVLKGHSMAKVTGTLKNMMGFPPPSHYQGGGWKKAAFHPRLHQAIRDLNRYITPHLTIMDASVGMTDYHLGGPVCDPPVGKLVAGTDPVAVDRAAAELLGIDWREVEHLR